MSTDAQRFGQLAEQKQLQFGTGKQVTAIAGNVADQLVRFQGLIGDLNPFRIYLHAWEPPPDVPPAALTAYNIPYPWVGLDPTTANPTGLSVFKPIQIYARVMWGAGGIQHVAYVDWPRRGALLQVSGSSVYVDAVSTNHDSSLLVLGVFPFLSASLGIEPGGGDSEACATYTYRRQDPLVAGPPSTWRFQIPPYARTYQILANRPALKAAVAGPLTIQEVAGAGLLGTIESAWEDDFTTNQDLALAQYPITQRGADILLSLANPSGVAVTDDLGIIFSLDL